MTELSPELNLFFKSIDIGFEQNLHQKYSAELNILFIQKEINDYQQRFITEFHFSAMDLIMANKDPTISYRRGIRHIPKIPDNLKNIIEKVLKILKDHNFSESSQLKLFINLVKMFLQDINLYLDTEPLKILLNNWVEEINSEEKIIIKQNEALLFNEPLCG